MRYTLVVDGWGPDGAVEGDLATIVARADALGPDADWMIYREDGSVYAES